MLFGKSFRVEARLPDDEASMRIIAVGEFRKKWLEVFREIALTGQPVMITRNGIPYIELASVGAKSQAHFLSGEIPEICVRTPCPSTVISCKK
jgi:antitoxin (DNA-binding transcriptional repressor) of toxin-antitoxin stability system